MTKEKEHLTDKIFIFLLGLLVLINMPSFLNIVTPRHDTMSHFQTFYFFYNEFFFHNQIPSWVPFGFYGVQSDYFLVTLLSPSSYFAILVGWILNIKNTLFLFELSMFIEQLILLSGTYLLAKTLFKHKTTIIFVCVTTICSTVLLSQPTLNFRIYLHLPLIIYFIIKYFSDYRPQYLMVALNILAISIYGLSPYMAPIQALAITIVFLTLLFANYKHRSRFVEVSRKDMLLSGTLLITLLIQISLYYYFIIHAMDFTEGFFSGRNAVTMKTDLGAFLTYAGESIGFKKFSALLYPTSEFILSGLTLHVGLLSLPLIIYGFAFVRNSLFIAFTGVVFVFGLFSLGGITPVAEFLYNYFPTMDYYRHIGHVVSNYKMFLPLLAGFGLDHFLGRLYITEEKKNGDFPKTTKIMVVSAEIVVGMLVILGSLIYSKNIIPDAANSALTITAVMLILLFLVHKHRSPSKHFSVFFISCVCFHMLSYQGLVNSIFYLPNEQIKPLWKSTVMVNKYDFQIQRTEKPVYKRTADALYFMESPGVRYTIAYNFLQWDPCFSRLRTDFLNSNVAELIRLKGGNAIKYGAFPYSGMRITLPDDTSFEHFMGCNSAKLKLFSNIVFSDTMEQSRDIIKKSVNINRSLVLNGVPGEVRSSWETLNSKHGNDGGGEIRINDFRANELTLEVHIKGSPGLWLSYSDAWHPGWRAIVNGEDVAVAQANIAFKAIYLKKGTNKVRFLYDNKLSKITGHFIILFGLIFVFALLVGMVSKLKIRRTC